MTEALRHVDKFESDILCGTWYFGADGARHNANNTLRESVTDGKSWKAVAGCAKITDPELADIRAFEAKLGITR